MEWIVHEVNGLGVVESPCEEGKALGIFTGTEDQVKAFTDELFHQKYPKPSGWDSPTFGYKPVVRLN